MATWPAPLPDPLLDGNAGDIAVPAQWVDMGAGWAGSVDLGNPVERNLSFRMALTEAQAGALAAFHRDYADQWATIPLHVPDDATALVEVLARLTGPITWAADAPGTWWATLAVEVAPA